MPTKFKYAYLVIQNKVRTLFSGFGFKLSFLLLLFSTLVSLMVLVPSVFNRTPIFSYFISEFEFPMTYELKGSIHILNKDGNLVNQDVQVYVGGYSTHLSNTTDFTLNFSAPYTESIFVTVLYRNPNGSMQQVTEMISRNAIKCTFNIEAIIYV